MRKLITSGLKILTVLFVLLAILSKIVFGHILLDRRPEANYGEIFQKFLTIQFNYSNSEFEGPLWIFFFLMIFSASVYHLKRKTFVLVSLLSLLFSLIIVIGLFLLNWTPDNLPYVPLPPIFLAFIFIAFFSYKCARKYRSSSVGLATTASFGICLGVFWSMYLAALVTLPLCISFFIFSMRKKEFAVRF